MKKTLITLLTLAGVAAADQAEWTIVNSYTPDTPYTLQQGTRGTALTFDTSILGGGKYFITGKDSGGNTSPALGKFEIDFSLTDTNLTATLFAVSTNSGAQAGWGATIKEGNLYFGQMTVNNGNTTSAMSSYTANCTLLGAVSTDTNYSLSVISWGSTTGNTLPGRGSDNFQITLTAGDTTIYNGSVAGFGLNSNGEGLTFVEIGGSNSTSETKTFGSVSSVSLSIIPEPATATLSLLALAGLAARRRRK